MNRRLGLLRIISGAAGMAGLNGCILNPLGNDSSWVMDDGVSDIAPNYLVTTLVGSLNAFVRADFMLREKKVQLKPDATIRLNTVLLQRDPKARASYVANVPLYTSSLNIDFVRSPGRIQKLQFSLPKLLVYPYPIQYQGAGPLEISTFNDPENIKYPGVIEDTYSMVIYAPSGEFHLSVEKRDFSRMTFKPSKVLPLPSDFYRARIFRQQRILLSGMSDYKSGWATISNGNEFVIEITE